MNILKNKSEEEDIQFSNLIENDFQIKINIDSPLLELLTKTKNFEKKYIIYISKKYR